MNASTDKTLRRRSPLASLDPLVLRELCELHPWDLGRLSAAAGFDRSVLSHVFAGRRSLPQSAASNFLSLIGLLPSGEPDRDHLFVFQARSTHTALLRSWLERLFPSGAEVVALHRSTQDRRLKSDADGWALFDSQTAVLVLGADMARLPVIGDCWPEIGHVEDADMLLNSETFPDRSYVVKMVSDVPSLERYIFEDAAGWEYVRRAAAKKGLLPADVLEMITQHEFPVPNGKTLFPLVHLSRKQSQEN